MAVNVYYHHKASSRKDRVRIPDDKTQMPKMDYQTSDDGTGLAEGVCYECGGNVVLTWGFEPLPGGGGATDLIAYHYDCMVCGLKSEYQRSNDLNGALATKARMDARVIAAWQVWFKHCMDEIIEGGYYPRWLTAGRPQAVTNPNPITADDY